MLSEGGGFCISLNIFNVCLIEWRHMYLEIFSFICLSFFSFSLQTQDIAIRCIQKNIRKFMGVRDWQWWRLLVRLTPMLNVHRTENELKARTVSWRYIWGCLSLLVSVQDLGRLKYACTVPTETFIPPLSTCRQDGIDELLEWNWNNFGAYSVGVGVNKVCFFVGLFCVDL